MIDFTEKLQRLLVRVILAEVQMSRAMDRVYVALHQKVAMLPRRWWKGTLELIGYDPAADSGELKVIGNPHGSFRRSRS